MMCFKAIVLVSAIVCLITAEKISLKERIFNCKLIPFKKHHSIFESIIPSIMVSPIDSAVPGDYTVTTGVTTLGTEPVPVPTTVPVEPQQEVQNPPPQQEVQNPPLQEVQYPPQPEVQYPVPQQEGEPPAAPQQGVQNPPQQQQPLYPPQHEGQRPTQHHAEQNPPSSNDGLYPPQHNGQYYPPQHNGQYYPPQHNGQYYQHQNEGMYYPPPSYQGFTANNVPYNYAVYGQNVLRSVKSLDGQAYPLQQHPYRVNMFIRQPSPYYNSPPVYGQYAAPQYNYVSQAPRTAQALTGGKAKST